MEARFPSSRSKSALSLRPQGLNHDCWWLLSRSMESIAVMVSDIGCSAFAAESSRVFLSAVLFPLWCFGGFSSVLSGSILGVRIPG